MGALDPLVNGVAAVLNGLDSLIEAVTNPDVAGEQVTEILGEALNDLTPADEAGAVLVDIVEEARDERVDEPRVAEVATVRWRRSA